MEASKSTAPNTPGTVDSYGSYDNFEELIFEGVLELVFDQLYELPLMERTFSALLVNKRWNRTFMHPIRELFSGSFSLCLAKYPPSFYYCSSKRRIWYKIVRSISITRQIANIEEDEKEREAFLVSEMLMHRFLLIECRNKRISQIIDAIRKEIRWIAERPTYRPNVDFEKLEPTLLLSEFTHHNYLILLKNVELSGGLFCDLSEILQSNRQFCEIAVKYNSHYLREVPAEWITREMCITAVQQDGSVFNHIPTVFQTQDLYNIAVKQGNIDFDDSIPAPLQTQENMLLAVHAKGSNLAALPHNQRTLDICRVAVKLDPKAIRFVPWECLRGDVEICKMAVAADGYLLKSIPHELRTAELCKLAVESCREIGYKTAPHPIRLVPSAHQSYVSRIAAEKNGNSVCFNNFLFLSTNILAD